ncbi:Dihydrofolate reductase [Schistosoma japonicum]|uniref:dihydrofolate reductase n=1 Tax=Schistosoma japonicum TaxID=6182 RepID=A0A4Z2CL16_SCHJA|nr:Dihydrofolate reductase [Schistosoma japonicum]
MRLNVIVAVSENWGIGKCGSLPWKLKKDMAYFKTVTTKAKSGKVTWESIPENFKPLKDRINVVVSSTLSQTPSGVQVVPNLNAAINLLHSEEFSSIVDEIFVIGGYSLYKEVLKQTIYPVRIYPDIPVDTFMENGLTYKFCGYEFPSDI